MSASDKLRTNPPAPEFSNDTGPTFRDGEMLLPTPTAGDHKSSGSRNLPGSGAHPGTSLTDAVREDRLLPSPNAARGNYDEDPETWYARRELLKAKGINGNGAGLPLGIAVRSISSAEDSPASPSAKPEDARRRTMHAGFGRNSLASFASLDPDGSWLKTSPDSSVQASLLGPLLERFSGIWPRWGSMRAGNVYVHPMSEPRTDENDSSSSLSTPMARDFRHHQDLPRQGGPSLPAQVESILPTPGAWLGRREVNSNVDDPVRAESKRHQGDRGRRSVELPEALAPLLPTPRTPSGRSSIVTPRHRTNGAGPNLEDSIGALTEPPSDDGSE